METLESQGLLPYVLSHLESLRDVIRCSAVRKLWFAASLTACLKSLEIPAMDNSQVCLVDSDTKLGIVAWLQKAQRRGCLAKISSLRFNLQCDLYDEMCWGTAALDGFCHSVLTISGLWNVEEVYIYDQFDINVVAKLLPPTVKHLRLEPSGDLSQGLDLSTFNRMVVLQSLTIYPYNVYAANCAIDRYPDGHFIVQNVFPHLESLTLNPCPLQLLDGLTLAQCFPMLQNIRVSTPVNHIADFLQLTTLKYLGLQLLRVYPHQALQTRLTIDQSSALRTLVLLGPVVNSLVLRIKKTDLDCKMCQMGKFGMVHQVQPQPYKPSSHFETLDRLIPLLKHW